jgi:invasion protein IalB
MTRMRNTIIAASGAALVAAGMTFAATPQNAPVAHADPAPDCSSPPAAGITAGNLEAWQLICGANNGRPYVPGKAGYGNQAPPAASIPAYCDVDCQQTLPPASRNAPRDARVPTGPGFQSPSQQRIIVVGPPLTGQDDLSGQ